MAVDNTHTKYLKGTDKKAWNDYKDAYESQKKLENFLAGFALPKNLKEGEEYDIPVRKDNVKPKKKKENN